MKCQNIKYLKKLFEIYEKVQAQEGIILTGSELIINSSNKEIDSNYIIELCNKIYSLTSKHRMSRNSRIRRKLNINK